MKIKILILLMIAGLSASAQWKNFNPYGKQINVANGDTLVRDVGSQSGQFVYSPTNKTLFKKSNKIQKVINADDYSDTFTGFESDGFNHGSAIWKILNENSFSNIKILLSAKRYRPISKKSKYYTLSNVSIQGVQQPYFENGLASLSYGSVIEGSLAIIQPSNDLFFDSFGIDAGKTVTDTYYESQSIDALVVSISVGDDYWGENITETNITTLCRNNTDPVHSNLLERFKNGYVNNIKTCFGIYGFAFKSQNISVGSIFSYGAGIDGVIIKSGEVSTYASTSFFESIYIDKIPPNISTSWVALKKADFGLYFEGGLPLSDFMIDKAMIVNCSVAVSLTARFSVGSVGTISINSIETASCDKGVVRDGPGLVGDIYIGNLNTYNITSNILDFSGGNPSQPDFGIRIGRINSHSANNVRGINGIIMSSQANQVSIGEFISRDVDNMFNVSNGAKLNVDTYDKNFGTTNLYASGSQKIIKTNVFSDVNGNSSVDGFITAAGFQNTAAFAGRNNIWRFKNLPDYGINYYSGYFSNADGIGFNFGDGINPVAYIKENGIIVSSFLSGTGDRVVFAGSDGGLKIGDLSGYQSIANLSSDLTSSTTKYPSVNAVNTGLSTKANKTGGNAFTGTQTVSGSTGTATITETSFMVSNNSTNTYSSMTPGSATFGTTGSTAKTSVNNNGTVVTDNSGNTTTYQYGSVKNIVGANTYTATWPQLTGTIALTSDITNATSGKANLAGGNLFTGFQTFSNGSSQPISGFSESGFLNSLQSNTLTTNVSTYLPSDGGQLVNSNYTGKKQVLTASGNGSATTISIAHGMIGITASSWVSAIANNAASAGIQYVTVDASNVNIFYTVAPASGTNNLLYSVEVKQ